MGINGLWEYIKNHYPTLNKRVPQKSFRGLRIAFDANSWFFVLRSAVRSAEIRRTNVIEEGVNEQRVDQIWIGQIQQRLLQFVAAGITPVLVYDGPSPVQKTKTKIKRTRDKEKILAKIEELHRKIRDTRAADAGSTAAWLRINQEHLEAMRALMCQLNYIPAESMALARSFFDGAGLPTLVADGDGERLASALCREGLAAAVYSADGDCLAHGCPVQIRDVGVEVYDTQGYAQATFELVFFREVLEAFEMSETQFLDLCIMAGCDYNENMSKIAMGKSVNIIRKFGSIDALPPEDYNITCLEHLDCRQLFARLPAAELVLPLQGCGSPAGTSLQGCGSPAGAAGAAGALQLAPFTEATWSHFASYGLENLAAQTRQVWETLPPARNFVHYSVKQVGPFLLEEGEELVGLEVLTQRHAQIRRGRGGARGRGRGSRPVASSSCGEDAPAAPAGAASSWLTSELTEFPDQESMFSVITDPGQSLQGLLILD